MLANTMDDVTDLIHEAADAHRTGQGTGRHTVAGGR
jgi:hypothetical protein